MILVEYDERGVTSVQSDDPAVIGQAVCTADNTACAGYPANPCAERETAAIYGAECCTAVLQVSYVEALPSAVAANIEAWRNQQ